jgi:hypothetical protein
VSTTQDDRRRRLAELGKMLDEAGFDHMDTGGEYGEPTLLVFGSRGGGIAFVTCAGVDPAVFDMRVPGVPGETADADRALTLVTEWRSTFADEREPLERYWEQGEAVRAHQTNALKTVAEATAQVLLLDELIGDAEPGHTVSVQALRERADDLRAEIDAAEAEARACREEHRRWWAERRRRLADA